MPELDDARAQRLVGRELAAAAGRSTWPACNDPWRNSSRCASSCAIARSASRMLFALHLGRVRGQHRRDMALGQVARDLAGRDAGAACAPSVRQAAVLHQVADALVRCGGGYGMVRPGWPGVAEKGEARIHADGLLVAQALSSFLSGRPEWSAWRRKATESWRICSISARVAFLTLVLANHLAELGAQQADVVDQRLVLARSSRA